MQIYVLLYALSFVFLLPSCSSTSKKFLVKETRITVGPGPEDMVVDRSTGTARLLISCASRREGESQFGEIVTYDPVSGVVDTLVRANTPGKLSFHPHGIFLDTTSCPQRLYAISHEKDDTFHPIHVFDVGPDTLFFREVISSELLHSPNALTIGPGGAIYIVNDSGKRGSLLEKILKLNRANIVRLEKDEYGKWQAEIAAEGLGYPAGINHLDSIIYVGDAVNHRLHLYRIQDDQLIPRDPIKGLTGNDNIRVCEGMLYIAGHVKPFKFISHAKSSSSISPVEVWKINPDNHKITSIYYTEGDAISAGSTAIMLNGKLYICQVFDPFILEIEF